MTAELDDLKQPETVHCWHCSQSEGGITPELGDEFVATYKQCNKNWLMAFGDYLLAVNSALHAGQLNAGPVATDA